jgi:hypothetical protein
MYTADVLSQIIFFWVLTREQYRKKNQGKRKENANWKWLSVVPAKCGFTEPNEVKRRQPFSQQV